MCFTMHYILLDEAYLFLSIKTGTIPLATENRDRTTGVPHRPVMLPAQVVKAVSQSPTVLNGHTMHVAGADMALVI